MPCAKKTETNKKRPNLVSLKEEKEREKRKEKEIPRPPQVDKVANIQI